MTITKSSVNYIINDVLENGWTISGNMNVTDNETSINLSVYDNSESENNAPSMNKEIGNFYYRKSDRINVTYSVVKESDETILLEACKKIVIVALSKD